VKSQPKVAQTKSRRQELLAQKKRISALLDRARKHVSHPHSSWQSVHDQAELEFKVYTAHLESIEAELAKLKRKKGR